MAGVASTDDTNVLPGTLDDAQKNRNIAEIGEIMDTGTFTDTVPVRQYVKLAECPASIYVRTLAPCVQFMASLLCRTALTAATTEQSQKRADEQTGVVVRPAFESTREVAREASDLQFTCNVE